jgi:hypothetical protein
LVLGDAKDVNSNSGLEQNLAGGDTDTVGAPHRKKAGPVD